MSIPSEDWSNFPLDDPSIQPFPQPIYEEMLPHMTYPQQILFILQFAQRDAKINILRQNLRKMSLYDLRIIKLAVPRYRDIIDREVRRRLDDNIYDQVLDLVNLDDFTDKLRVCQFSSNLELVYQIYAQDRDNNANPRDLLLLLQHITFNQNMTLEFLLNHPDLSITMMNSNKAITQEFFESNISSRNYYEYSMNPNITKDFFLRNYLGSTHRQFDTASVAHFIDYDVLTNHFEALMYLFDTESGYYMFSQFDITPIQFETLIQTYPILNRISSTKYYLCNKNAPLEYLRDILNANPIKEYYLFAMENPNITFDFLLESINMYTQLFIDDGVRKMVRAASINPGISIDTILKNINIDDIINIRNIKWDLFSLCKRLDVSLGLLEEFPFKEYGFLNRNIDAEYIRTHNLASRIPYVNRLNKDSKYIKLAKSILDMP